MKTEKGKKSVVQYVFEVGKIVVKSGNSIYAIWYSDIVSIVIETKKSNSIRFNCHKGHDIIVEGTLVEIMKLLPEADFIMVHKSFIANMFHAIRFIKHRNTGVLHLTKDLEVNVSKVHFEEVEKAMYRGANFLDVSVVEVIKKGK